MGDLIFFYEWKLSETRKLWPLGCFSLEWGFRNVELGWMQNAGDQLLLGNYDLTLVFRIYPCILGRTSFRSNYIRLNWIWRKWAAAQMPWMVTIHIEMCYALLNEFSTFNHVLRTGLNDYGIKLLPIMVISLGKVYTEHFNPWFCRNCSNWFLSHCRQCPDDNCQVEIHKK